MKKTLLAAAVLLCAVAARATTNPFGSFQSQAVPESLKPFALDLGGLLGSASAHTGRTLGFPGFWVGGVVAEQARPDKDDTILRSAGVHQFLLPMVEAGVGLPLIKTDVIVHGVSYDGVKVYGGGLRTSLYRTDLIDTFLPNLSAGVFGDKVDADAFNAAHLGLDAAATWNLPIIKPFLVAGYDVTKLKVGAANPTVDGQSATARGSRFSAGADLTPFPFLSLRGAYTIRHGVSGIDAGLGVKF